MADQRAVVRGCLGGATGHFLPSGWVNEAHGEGQRLSMSTVRPRLLCGLLPASGSRSDIFEKQSIIREW